MALFAGVDFDYGAILDCCERYDSLADEPNRITNPTRTITTIHHSTTSSDTASGKGKGKDDNNDSIHVVKKI
jgi:hypothetical protein